MRKHNSRGVIPKLRAGITRSILILVVTILGVSGFYAPAHAQVTPSDGVEMTLTPTKTRVSLIPGETQEGDFTILNSGSVDFTFKTYASPYQVTNEQYDPEFTKETARTQISRWIILPEQEFTLKPGEEAKVPYTIAVPQDVASGGQYAVIFAETVVDDNETGVIIAKKRVGMLVYGSTEGDTREDGAILSHTIRSWQYDPPLSSQWRVENRGNTDFATTTQMTVSSFWGKVLYESPKTENTVFPGTVRAMTLSWDEAGIGVYRVATTVTFLDKTDQKEAIVLLMPPRVAVGILVGILVLCAGIIFLLVRKQRTKKAHISSQTQQPPKVDE